jgi:hypothetical protein
MYIVILLLYFKNHQLFNINRLNYSIFQKPVKKKSVIFLRAPYKNKLARLNILKLEFTTILSIKCNEKLYCNNLNDIYKNKNYNFSTHKLKHTKTKINFMYKYKKNFKICNYTK